MSLRRDLLWLYGIPLLVYGLAYWYWRDSIAGFFEGPRHSLRSECGVNLSTGERQHPVAWRGLHWPVPFHARIHRGADRLEIREVAPGCRYLESGAHLMVLEFTDRDHAAFLAQERSTCGLAQDRCWTESAGRYHLVCMRSGGIPEPHVDWTPTLLCEIPERRWLVLIRGEDARFQELLSGLRKALEAGPPPPAQSSPSAGTG